MTQNSVVLHFKGAERAEGCLGVSGAMEQLG